MKPYKTILNNSEAELTEKKSKFLSAAFPVETEDEATILISRTRKAHYNATHNVYAYILGQNMETQRFSDDGEPSGTAGMPVLNVIKNEGIINTLVIVTRYFGGILLGAGGLARAYSKAAKLAVNNAIVIEKLPFNIVEITVGYSLSGKTRYEILNNGYTLTGTKYETDVVFTALVEESATEHFSSLINDITGADALIDVKEPVYAAITGGILKIIR